MSLFPAYSNANVTGTTSEPATWLQNSSFSAKPLGQSSGTSDPSTSHTQPVSKLKRNRKKEKEKAKKKRIDQQSQIVVKSIDLDWQEDKRRNEEFLQSSVLQLYRPLTPQYVVQFDCTKVVQEKRPRGRAIRRIPLRRYHRDKRLIDELNGFTEKVANGNGVPNAEPERDIHFTGFKQEQELSQKTAHFNKTLSDSPNNVDVWLEYIQFQNVIYDFEKTYRKGSIAKGQRVLAERKLCILDKALSLNPTSELLLRERLHVAVTSFPSDELQTQLKALVEKDQGNLILWQGYIESIQCSMSHCSTASVLDLYTKCLSILHKLRRAATLDKPILEESILRMLYQCGLFLKQTGLFEQLWTTLRLYLELNLSPNDPTKFNLASSFNEANLVELEELVFSSQLPLHELWLRTEKLRESCHWLPFTEERECDDPQRVVFAEDVSDLIHPITMPENIFKLTATVLSLLKVPLLPCRHNTMQGLGLDYVPWALDSIEALLPVFFPFYPIDLTNETLLNEERLAIGPQYLKVLPGQEEYLMFVLMIMQNCIDCLTGQDKIAMTIWWMRFQRLLVVLDKQKRFKMPEFFKKKIKTSIKAILKIPENRNVELYYCEYALIEYELGNSESCTNILKMALGICKNSVFTAKNWTQDQAVQCYLYRNLIEITQVITPNAQSANFHHLIGLVLQRKPEEVVVSTETLLHTETKFNLITVQLLQNPVETKRSLAEHFLPDFFCDWIICYGWFLFLTKGAMECGIFLETTLTTMEEAENAELWLYQREVIYEFYVGVLFKYCVNNPGAGVFKLLDKVLFRAIQMFPNNLMLLATLAKEHTFINSSGPQWWRVKELLLKTGRAHSTVFAVLIAMQRMTHLEDLLVDTITGERFQATSLKYNMLSLFKQVTNDEICTRRCGLVWRLYLQFVHQYFTPNICRNVYFAAVDQCPWIKVLYIDAAVYIPAELAQIQDIIIEKQLRLHVTPEELEVLRS